MATIEFTGKIHSTWSGSKSEIQADNGEWIGDILRKLSGCRVCVRVEVLET